MLHAYQLRRLVAVAALLFCVGSAHADASDREIGITYAPGSREITLSMPRQLADKEDIAPPAWLSPLEDGRADTLTLSGRLPPIKAGNRMRGAATAGAFAFDMLAWLPAQHAEARVRLSVPHSHRAVANANLLSETVRDGTYTATFAPVGPLRGLAVFFGPYKVSQARTGDTVMRTYFPDVHEDVAQDYLDAAGRYLSRYTARIGEYAYDGFNIVSAPVPVGYGLAGMTYVSERILGHPYMLGRSLAHEVLHGWWGNAVGVDYARGNWAEGLTSYQADHALAEEAGPAAARAMRRDWLTALTALGDKDGKTLRDFVSAGHRQNQSVGYGKAAMLFHMLKNDLGPRLFDAGLQRFYADHRGGIAGWGDLRAAFEQVSGRDLGQFFEQWLDRPGLPRVELVAASAARSGNGYTVTLQLGQDTPPYALDLPVRITTTAGATTETLHLGTTRRDFVIKRDERPVSVAVDPGFDVARVLLGGELPVTLGDVLKADAPTLAAFPGYEDAARELAKAVPDATVPTSTSPDALAPGGSATILVGPLDKVLDTRAAAFGSAPPDTATAGQIRAWAERDPQGRLWLFAAGEAPRIAEGLAALRYYAGQSYVISDGSGGLRAGRWPVTRSPMTRRLD